MIDENIAAMVKIVGIWGGNSNEEVWFKGGTFGLPVEAEVMEFIPVCRNDFANYHSNG